MGVWGGQVQVVVVVIVVTGSKANSKDGSYNSPLIQFFPIIYVS